MANLVVYVDLHPVTDGGTGALPRLTGSTRFALQGARRIARALGATVHAIVVTGQLSVPALEHLAAAVGSAGADRVLVCSDPSLGAIALHPTHGGVLAMVARKLHPRLILFPAGAAAAQLAAPLAAELRAVFFPGASMSSGKSHLLFSRALPDWSGKRIVDVLMLDRPLVATMAAGRPHAESIGSETSEAELHILALDETSASIPAERKPVVKAITEEASAGQAATGGAVAWEDAHTVVLARGLPEASEEAPAGVLIIRGERTPVPSDVLCPATLVLMNPTLTNHPPMLAAADAVVIACSQRKPPPTQRGITLLWKADPDKVLPEVLNALEAVQRTTP